MQEELGSINASLVFAAFVLTRASIKTRAALRPPARALFFRAHYSIPKTSLEGCLCDSRAIHLLTCTTGGALAAIVHGQPPAHLCICQGISTHTKTKPNAAGLSTAPGAQSAAAAAEFAYNSQPRQKEKQEWRAQHTHTHII
jgi:hypothetical protein